MINPYFDITDMKLHGIYFEKIKSLPNDIMEDVIREAPHTRIVGPLPPALSFLGGGTEFVDLGFENLRLSPAEKDKIRFAFVNSGVAIPGSDLKLRYARTGVTVIEPIAPGEAIITLPDDWMEAVMVIGNDNKPSYVGKLVRPDQR